MLSRLPRRSGWEYQFAQSPSRVSLPRKGCRVGLRIVLFEMLWDTRPERYILGAGYESLEHCHGK